MGILDWLRRRNPNDVAASRLPGDWESVGSVTVVIPFSEDQVPHLEAALLQALKIRDVLKQIYHLKYFPDEAYSSILKLRDAGKPLGSKLEKYWETANRQADDQIADKIRIILLHNNSSHRISQIQQIAVTALAGRFPGIDVLDFGGDPMVKVPRQGVVMSLVASNHSSLSPVRDCQQGRRLGSL